jgi:hypothetical protein
MLKPQAFLIRLGFIALALAFIPVSAPQADRHNNRGTDHKQKFCLQGIAPWMLVSVKAMFPSLIEAASACQGFSEAGPRSNLSQSAPKSAPTQSAPAS